MNRGSCGRPPRSASSKRRPSDRTPAGPAQHAPSGHPNMTGMILPPTSSNAGSPSSWCPGAAGTRDFLDPGGRRLRCGRWGILADADMTEGVGHERVQGRRDHRNEHRIVGGRGLTAVKKARRRSATCGWPRWSSRISIWTTAVEPRSAPSCGSRSSSKTRRRCVRPRTRVSAGPICGAQALVRTTQR